VSRWMDEGQNLRKLQSIFCEVKVYYSSDSFSPSPKEVFLSKTEAQSSTIVVMSVMMTGANN